MIKVSNIHKRFGDLEVLKGVSLEVKAGEIVSIVGASGAGKTTLLQIIGTLLPADSGEVEIAGVKVLGMSEKHMLSSVIAISVLFFSFTIYCRSFRLLRM